MSQHCPPQTTIEAETPSPALADVGADDVDRDFVGQIHFDENIDAPPGGLGVSRVRGAPVDA